METYLSDFENKRLKRDLNSSFKIYGQADVRLRWGALNNSTPNNGIGTMNLGYKFKDKSPYFTITIYPTFNEHSKTTDSVTKESMMLSYYFTRAQIADFISMLSDESIANSLSDYTDDEYYQNKVKIDDYEEYVEEIVE